MISVHRPFLISTLFIILLLIVPSLSENGSINESSPVESSVMTPDLSLSALEVIDSVKTGEELFGSVVVTNKGPVSATKIVTEFFLEKKGIEASEITWLGSRASEEVLPGLKGKIPFSFQVPKGITEGDYVLEVTIHAYETELFGGDNSITSIETIRLIEGEPWKGGKPNIQLFIDSIHPNQTSPVSPLDIQYRIVNTNGESAGSFNTAFFLLPERNLTSLGYRLREERSFSLHGNMNETGISRDLIPDHIPLGTYYLAGFGDYTGMIQETIESDNTYIYPEQIEIVSSEDFFSDSYATKIAGYLFLKTNKYREYLGLSAISYDEKLSEIAYDHSLDMIQRSYFSHYTPEGIDPEGRANLVGYETTRRMDDGSFRTGIAENIIRIAAGHTVGKAYTGFVDPTTPEEIADVMMLEWIKSPEHNKNLINPTIEKIGIGTKFDGEYFYATQNFF